MRPKYINVRARSANVGSGTAGWSLAVPGPACFLADEVVIAVFVDFRPHDQKLELFVRKYPFCPPLHWFSRARPNFHLYFRFKGKREKIRFVPVHPMAQRIMRNI